MPIGPARLAEPPPFERREGQVDWDNRVTTLVSGQARGRLLGGNLCLMAHLTGTPYAPDLRGAILFLEDVDEPYYRIDRFLTQLWLSGALDGVAGVAFGKFTRCEPSASFVQNRVLERSLFPYVVLLQVTPIVAIAPLIIGNGRPAIRLPPRAASSRRASSRCSRSS